MQKMQISHIPQNFRSRGIRLDINGQIIAEKEYYEPDPQLILNNDILNEAAKKWSYFEHSVKKEENIVDSINFHTDMLTRNPENVLLQDSLSIKTIRTIFDDSFKAYTIGLRLKGPSVIAESVYYYPTVWKGNRFGIRGITDTDIIQKECSRFASYLRIKDEAYVQYVNFIEKLKGLSITKDYEGNVGYKIYAYVDEKCWDSLLMDSQGVKDCISRYGNIKLVAIRISNGCIVGFNIYFV